MKKSTSLKYGILTSIVLIAFFLVLSLVGGHISPGFSVFNGFFLAIGMYFAIKQAKEEQGNSFDYTSGFMIGIRTGLIATFLFTLFFWGYATELNPNFLPDLMATYGANFKIGIGLIVFTVAIMGVSSTLVLSLTFMQLFKRSRNLA